MRFCTYPDEPPARSYLCTFESEESNDQINLEILNVFTDSLFCFVFEMNTNPIRGGVGELDSRPGQGELSHCA